MRGLLFTQDFLREGIRHTRTWKDTGETHAHELRDRLRDIFKSFPVHLKPNEAVTEQELILPVLQALGWTDYLPQQTTSVRGRQDVPDVLLFPNAEAKSTALSLGSSSDRYRHATAIVESKRWQRPLDRSSTGDAGEGVGAPSTQMLRYLSRAEVQSEKAVQWGILTNGQHWRLYYQGARSRSEEFLEFELPLLLELPGAQQTLEEKLPPDAIRIFYLLFRRASFLPDPADPEGRPFVLVARDEGKLWEETVSRELGAVVFEEVFPELVRNLVANDPQRPPSLTADYLETVRRGALTFLYRLLFLLYAEDRDLLPARDSRYDDYSLRKIRKDIAKRVEAADVFSEQRDDYHHHLRGLFRAVAEGDPSIGLPAYDGGLFALDEDDVLSRAKLPDSAIAPVLYRLSHRITDDSRHWINYRDLSVQHLGSIYERLLEFQIVEENGELAVRLQPYARKGSGSYYTHDDLVELIIRRAVGPLVEEVHERFVARVQELGSDPRPIEERLDLVRDVDPAEAILGLRICDPAMGSGHFLVGLVDHLTDRVLESMAEVEVALEWLPPEHQFGSPLSSRLQTLRQRILDNAKAEEWVLDPGQLDDRHLVRRLVLKRCVYGVDKNPMAVELAKVALWLHTFTAGAPLSFLNHHLRVGDSLYGEWVAEVAEEIREAGALYVQQAVTRLRNAALLMQEISEIADADLEEVGKSKSFFHEADTTLAPLRKLMDLWHSLRWYRATNGSDHPGVGPLFRGVFGDLLEVLQRGYVDASNGAKEAEALAVNDLLQYATVLGGQERFLHWELAFPSVWPEMHRLGLSGGFDALIGNPPWDRMKLQQVEWFALRKPEIAAAPRAADRKRAIEQLAEEEDPLYDDYLAARERAEAAAEVARNGGHYPLLGRGDINIYSLFVERAVSRLIRPQGMLGLLVPSGIASDKTASEFFSEHAGSGRLAALLDFENKKVFFPDVHASFKFSVLVLGGEKRQFPAAKCAFFLHSVEEINDPETGSFLLTPSDFRAVNPNTGTAPVFRRRRDAEITTQVYQRLPVLLDRRDEPPLGPWPFRYKTMFHMTNDSGHFKTKPELETDGFYPVGGNVWKRGQEEYVPLYEGKMVQMYDHRAASIELHPENIHRPAQPVPASLEQHRDSKWLPDPQYWVPRDLVREQLSSAWALGFKDVTAPTNVRTMIAAIVPGVGAGNTLPLLESTEAASDNLWKVLLLANLNSFAFDFIARQKVQGQHLNLYILEQLPVVPPEQYLQKLGDTMIADFVKGEVLRLTYTAVDLKSFAQELGYDGDPSSWDEEDRRHRMARLDALFFHLYGMSRDDAEYVLSQFPIVQADDEKEFGRFMTRDLVLAYMNAVAAGDLRSRVTI